MDQASEYKHQGLHDRGHARFVDLPYHTHEEVSIYLRLDFVDNLDYIVTQLHGCLFISGR